MLVMVMVTMSGREQEGESGKKKEEKEGRKESAKNPGRSGRKMRDLAFLIRLLLTGLALHGRRCSAVTASLASLPPISLVAIVAVVPWVHIPR